MDRPTIPGDVVVADGLPLALRGTPPGDCPPELVPDAIPSDGPEPTSGSRAVSGLPHDNEGRIGNDLASLSWRYRLRWLDDAGR